jgi:hypothetical protein
MAKIMKIILFKEFPIYYKALKYVFCYGFIGGSLVMDEDFRLLGDFETLLKFINENARVGLWA